MNASECKVEFLGVLDDVASQAERAIITKSSKPVAVIVPLINRAESIRGALEPLDVY